EVQKIWNMAEVKRTPVEWALQYLWNRDDVDCVLSGMTSLEQVKENIKIASTEDIISEYDQELIREVARTYRTFLGNRCTRCGYCMPCPHGVDIINCLNEYNIAHMMNDPKASAMQYFSLIDDDSRADSCVECMECLPFCTQMLNIPEELQKVYEYFGSEFDHF
ncbi:MAG: 4Fe-4S dicluster domain-containing protein, partial [Methanobrevibacter sp.]|nr:4Fe-4S dicluster domain-containing protein [Methanobrevibacter sp.]